MQPKILFCDLAHRGHSCNAVPYAVSLILAYARKYLPGSFDYALHKSPDELSEVLSVSIPDVICFSNYIWNSDLNYEIADRIKAKKPETVTIFGGPNYPIVPSEQKAYLEAKPAIDFYIYKDGEKAFLELLKKLIEFKFDAAALRGSRALIPNTHFFAGKDFITGPLIGTVDPLDDIPSPYLEGLLDRFFPQKLVPLLQTTRGCPFKCTFCQDGDLYASRVKRYERERIDTELEYIAKRSQAPQLLWADLNFGMYKQDLDTCRTIARLQKQYGWPQNLDLNGKNQKERVLEAARIIDGHDLEGGTVMLVAAVQSTDRSVLENVKRENVSTDAMVGVAVEGRNINSNSFSEIILCLPGDSKRSHISSINQLMECGINVVRSHQFIMLNGSEAGTLESRKRFGMMTRYRVTPKTAVNYKFFGDTFARPEIDEICVANNTMSFDDYLACRQFNLTVEIFYNYGLFVELLALLRRYEVSIADFIGRIHERAMSPESPLAEVYENFRRESLELFTTREEIEEFLRQPGVIERYQNGELGNNEQLMYRALAVFHHMNELHQLAFDEARKQLREAGALDDAIENYLKELVDYSLLRKKDMLTIDRVERRRFKYDFAALNEKGFEDEPTRYFVPGGVEVEFFHSNNQKKMVTAYVDLYGLERYGLGNILGSQTNVNNLYRRVRAI